MSDYFFGERAHDLPGREILDSFNVLDHRVEDSLHVARTPDGAYIVRWLLPNRKRPDDRDGLMELAQRAGRHFGDYVNLSDGAVQVPDYRVFAAESPNEPEMPDSWLGRLALFSVLPVVGSHKLRLTNDPAGEYPVLAGARYLKSIYETDAPELLGDLYKPGQFRHPTRTEAPMAWLVDKDELLTSTAAGGLRSAIRRLQAWHVRLPKTEVALEAGVILAELAANVPAPATEDRM